MHTCKYPHIFKPMTIKGITFKNRVFASPITANRVVDHGYPTPEGIDAYETKARGGFALVTLTESFIDHEYSWRHEHGLNVWENPMTTFHMESIMTLTETITAHGDVASIQLNHVGAQNHPDAIPGHKNPIGPSAFVREDGVQVEEMTVEMMEETARRWAEAAWNCKALGFNMVNLHGGHGWLLNQFISPRFNHRTDEYGGSMENRARFPIMVCKKIKEVCGDDFLIEYRLSGSERIKGGMTLEDGIEFAKIIQDYVDIIHVTSGVYQDHVNTKAFSSMFDPHGCNLDLAEAIKKNVHVPVVAVGGFNGPEQIEAALAAGKCDFVALGRQQFADPEFVNKVQPGDIIVANKNFGCGSSREHAPLCLKTAGVSCVIAETFARIFYRNAINIGLPIIECPAKAIEAGDEVEIDFDSGKIYDRTKGTEFKGQPFPEFMQKLIAAGGLVKYTNSKRK